MTQAVAIRKQGDDFQARLFWLHAALLLNPNSGVIRVAYETGPKAFDDVLVEYDPERAPQDHKGRPVLRDHLQCKWHSRTGEFGHDDLTDPAFTNATAKSFLQRALDAQVIYAPEGEGARFKLVTNWRLKHGDPLTDLILQQTHAVDLDRLFDGTGDASKMGRLRKHWRDHLVIDDAELRRLARTLGITQRLESAEDLVDRLNDRFAHVGLVQASRTEAGFFYDDLIAKLHAQGRANFDRKTFKEMCDTEQLLEKRQPHATTIGVRSFMHPIDNLEDRCERTLNLVPHFDGRYIRDPADWNGRLLPDLKTFVLEAARSTDHLRVVLDAHVSLAFAVGALLNVKSGKHIEIEQRTAGRRFWTVDDLPADAKWPQLVCEEEPLPGPGDGIAVAIGLTHDVSSAVRTYAEARAEIGTLLHVRPEGGPSGKSVQCGRHAHMLAEALTARLRQLQHPTAPQRRVHIFIAAPNAFAFFLGQNQTVIGPAAIYEWDFERQRTGTYSLGLEIG